MKSIKGTTLLEVIVTMAIVGGLFLITNLLLFNYYDISKEVISFNESAEDINIIYKLFETCVNTANKQKEKIKIEFLSDEHTMISLEDSDTYIEFLYDELGQIYSYYNGNYIRVLNYIKDIQVVMEENILKLTIKNINNKTYRKNYYVINV